MLINKVMSSSRLGLLVRKAVIVKLLVNFLHNWMFMFHFTEARRSFLEVYPEAATNEDPVLLRSSIIPWWAWIRRSHLPEAELLNGRAAMLGFSMAYMVDALTGMGVVGQTGNVLCKAGVFATVVAVLFFRRNQDIETFRKLVDEATFYDKQWQASWQDEAGSASASDSSAEKM
ncbi:light-harvesting complex-like protein 3 isotype 1, chloroplastic [Syzygium oleosum]|uniref:light-harvesting complex-like protein 3 isotype 1, chloroplastic n=1 Tax=Syzygium oleosum TaxID=219896 RepID=UPI0024BB99C4|nr:light-harvesting complex-like protein 3 isotype 1, chloroplastic [Syzygium oleosum]